MFFQNIINNIIFFFENLFSIFQNFETFFLFLTWDYTLALDQIFLNNFNHNSIEIQKNVLNMMPTPKPGEGIPGPRAYGHPPAPKFFKCNSHLFTNCGTVFKEAFLNLQKEDLSKKDYSKDETWRDTVLGLLNCPTTSSILYRLGPIGDSFRELFESSIGCPGVPTAYQFSYITELESGRTFMIDHCSGQYYAGASRGATPIHVYGLTAEMFEEYVKPRGPGHPLGEPLPAPYKINSADFSEKLYKQFPPSSPSIKPVKDVEKKWPIEE